jgi:hypothetical protein
MRARRRSQGHSAAGESSMTLHAAEKAGSWSRRSSSCSPRRHRAPAASEPARLGRSLGASDRLIHPPSVGSRPCLTNPCDGGCVRERGRYGARVREWRAWPQLTPYLPEGGGCRRPPPFPLESELPRALHRLTLRRGRRSLPPFWRGAAASLFAPQPSSRLRLLRRPA